MSGFRVVERATAASGAIAQIKGMIADGRLEPGERLPPERELCETLGISRPTLREAIGSLQAMRLLESRPGSGTVVASLELADMLRPLQFALSLAKGGWQDLFETRLVLEPAAAALAAQRRTDEELAAIVALADREDRPGAIAQVLEIDVELHRLIVAASHNDILVNLHASLSALAVESRTATIGLPGVARRAMLDHRRIVDALAGADAEAARTAMHDHLVRVRDAAFDRSGAQRAGTIGSST